MNFKRNIPQAFFAMLLMWSGCGGHGFWNPSNPINPSNPPKFAYAANFSNGGTGSVSAYTVSSSNGALTAVSG